jgi:DNA-binding CsgD family transcriptional regulator
VSAPVRVLTRRQVEALRLVANGHTNAEAAALLSVSAETVATSLRLTYRALGVGDRAHAVAVALRVGLLRPGDVRVPETLRARLAPVAASEAPEPRPAAAGRSGGDGAGFNGPGRASSRTRDSRSDPSEAENALHGGSPGLAAPDGPGPASSL